MSGGHWNYMSNSLEELGEKNKEVWRLLSVIEHELDWGICHDTCYECAKNRVVPAIEAFFDESCRDATKAVALMRDREQFKCERCKSN